MPAKYSKIPAVPVALGLVGLLPFLTASALSLLTKGNLKETSIRSLMTYGTVTLSCLGGVTWGARLGNKTKVNDWCDMTWGVIPSLIAWPCLLFTPIICLPILASGFLLQYFLDADSVKSKLFPVWYGTLQMILTAGAVSSLAIGVIGLVITK